MHLLYKEQCSVGVMTKSNSQIYKKFSQVLEPIFNSFHQTLKLQHIWYDIPTSLICMRQRFWTLFLIFWDWLKCFSTAELCRCKLSVCGRKIQNCFSSAWSDLYCSKQPFLLYEMCGSQEASCSSCDLGYWWSVSSYSFWMGNADKYNAEHVIGNVLWDFGGILLSLHQSFPKCMWSVFVFKLSYILVHRHTRMQTYTCVHSIHAYIYIDISQLFLKNKATFQLFCFCYVIPTLQSLMLLVSGCLWGSKIWA